MQQASLFAAAAPFVDASFDASFEGARRIELDEHSWLEHVPGWLPGSEELCDELRERADWEQRTRWMFNQRVTEPRLTAE
jgi:hypothetical protein